MKHFGFALVIGLIVVGVSATSCSSKETRSEEPVISGSASDASPVASANLGGSSSGQGR